MWPAKTFFGLFNSLRDILCLRSLLGCSYPISKFNIIPKGKWFKFPISNHSDRWWGSTENESNILVKSVVSIGHKNSGCQKFSIYLIWKLSNRRLN